MLLPTIRRILLKPSSYFLLPLRGVAAPGSFYLGMPSPKPPNVLVFTNEDPDTGQPRFNAVKETLNMCVSPDYYTVYPLTERQVKTTPWLSSTKLLIIACNEVSYTASRIFTEYFLRGGNLLVMASKLSLPGVAYREHRDRPCPTLVDHDCVAGAHVMEGQLEYTFEADCKVETLASDQESRSLIFELKSRNGKGYAVLSQIHLEFDPVFFTLSEDIFTLLKKSNQSRVSILRHILSTRFHLNCDSVPRHELSLGHVFCATKEEHNSLLSRIQGSSTNSKIVDDGVTFHYITPDQTCNVEATPNYLPVILSSGGELLSNSLFNSKIYFETLKTHNLGRIVLFVENATSTMTTIKAMCNTHGSISVASRQLNGKGRGGNAWLGPVGCTMFTLCLHIPLHSPLGQRSPFVQHLAALALAKAVRSTNGYQTVNIRLKWPNDIYYGSDVKLGGVLVSSTVNKDTITCYIGCGINVSNSQPTLCINDIAKVASRSTTQGHLRPLTREEIIAKSLNELEFLVAMFQGGGVNMILQDYYKYWLHG